MLVAALGKSLLHVQAGVPCPLRTVTGIPCPLCGMTTSVSATVSGDVGAAIRANPVGPILVLIALALLVIPRRQTVNVPRWLLPAALVLMWAWQLARFNVV